MFSPRSVVLTVFFPNLARASKEARAFLGNYILDSLFVSGTKGKRLTYKGLIQ